MWSQAVYDLGLTTAEFWRLTPRLFKVLFARHREALLHRELLAAYTTAAVINFSQFSPKTPVPPIRFMPNHRDAAKHSGARKRVNHQAVAASLRGFFASFPSE